MPRYASRVVYRRYGLPLYRSILRYALALNKYWTLLVQSPRQSVSRVVSFVGKTRDEGTLLGLT